MSIRPLRERRLAISGVRLTRLPIGLHGVGRGWVTAQATGLILALFALPVAAGVFDLDPTFWHKYLVPGEEIVTPHIAWCKPGTQKKIKALFIVRRGSTREAVELAQRMDLDYRVFALGNGEFFVAPYIHSEADRAVMPDMVKDPRGMAKELEKMLTDSYDLIVLGFVGWDSLPWSARYLILKKVKEGTPLVGLVFKIDEYLARATETKITPEFQFLFPYKALPVFSKYSSFRDFTASTVAVSQFGQGKIVQLKGLPQVGGALTPGIVDDPLAASLLDYDYYCAYVIHLMRWAVGHEPKCRIRGVDYLRIDRAQPVPVQFTIDSGARRKVVCRFMLRDRDNRVLVSQEKSRVTAPGSKAIEFALPADLVAGGYYADLWVVDEGRIDDFGSAFVEVTSANSIAGIDIPKSVRKEAPIQGKVRLSLGAQAEGLSLEVVRKDNHGRVTHRVSMPVNGRTAVPFELPAIEPLTVLQYLQAELRQGPHVMDRRQAPFTIANLYLTPDDIVYVTWGGGGGYLGARYFELLRQAGFDAIYTRAVAPQAVRANLHQVSYATRFADTVKDRKETDHVRVPCLNDPAYLESEAKNLRQIATQMQPFSDNLLSLGDETMFAPYGSAVELCFCPLCVGKFHAFLKSDYGTIENLNQEYQSSHKSFEEVQPVTLGEARQDAKLVPLWVDFRRHMESTWAGMFQFCRDTVQRVNPDAQIGYEGSDMMMNSFLAMAGDYWKMSQVARLNNPYETPFAAHVVPDLGQPGSLLGIGYISACGNIQRTEVQSRFYPWHFLFHGANCFMVHFANPGYSPCGMMAPDFSWYDFFKANIREVQEIKGGIGKLLLSATRDGDKTALLYSASSVHAATVAEQQASLTMERVLSSYVRLFDDARRHFKVVAYAQVADGVLERDGYRWLILPYAQALSRAEVEHIVAFVRNGGTVIADLRPGVCDEHGKPYPTGLLDEVFGVQQDTATFKAKWAEVTINRPGTPGAFPKTQVDAGLKVTTGKASADAGGVPALIENSYGTGRAILLNFSMAEYMAGSASSPQAGPNVVPVGAFFRALCSLAGMPAAIEADPELPGLRTYRFTSGDAAYLGVMQDMPGLTYFWGNPDPNRPQTPGLTRLTLPTKSNVYDVRAGKSLGCTDQIDGCIPIGNAQLFALLPYRVKKLAVDVPGTVRQGAALQYQVTVKTDGARAGRHVLRVVLVSPDGVEAECYSRNAVAENGELRGRITLALNETLGRWRLTVKDIATGTTAEKSLRVKKSVE